MLTLSHHRSGHQVILSDPTLVKVWEETIAIVFTWLIWNSRNMIRMCSSTKCISRVFNICGLRSNRYRDLSHKFPIFGEIEQLVPVPRVRIKSLPFLQYHPCICNHWCSGSCCSFEVPLKGHLRSSQVMQVHKMFFAITRNICSMTYLGHHVTLASGQIFNLTF